MKKLILIISIIALVSCEKSVVGVNNTDVQQSFKDELILPLKVGNSWSYEAEEIDADGTVNNVFRYKKEITDVRHFGEETWYRAVNSEYPHANIFYKFNIDGLYTRLPDYFGDHVFHQYMYRGDLGDLTDYQFRNFWSDENSHNQTEITNLERHITINNITYSCIEYTTMIELQNSSKTLIEYFAPGLGLIERDFFDDSGTLYRRDKLLNYNLIKDI